MRFWNFTCFILFLIITESVFAVSGTFGFEVVIQKPDNSFLQDPNVDFKFTVTDDSGACVIYSEEHLSIDMSGTNGQKTFQLGNTLLQTYPNPLVTTLTIDQVFSSSGVVYNCQGGGTYTSTTSASRKVIMEFNDGSGLQTLPALAINSVPYAVEAQKVVNNSITTQNILDGTITSSDLSSMGASAGQVMKWDGSAWVASNDNSGSGLVTSVAGRTGAVTLSSSDISGLGTLAGKNQANLATDVTGTLSLSNIAQSSATTGQVMKWDGSAWVASNDETGAGGTVTNVTASGPLSSSGGGTPNISITQANGTTSGYLSSADWTLFNAKLSDFSTLTSADITGKLGYTPLANYGSMTSTDVTTALGYTPVNPATAVISVAGRTGAVTLSSSDISGLGTLAGKSAIVSADLSAGSVTFDKLNQSSATTGQVIKWDGSGWVVSNDSSGLTDFSTLTSADITGKLGYTPLANYGLMTSTDVTTALTYVPLSPSTPFSGDVSGSYNAITVDRIKNIPVALSSLTSGDIVQYNGSAFVNRNIPTCAANQYLTFDGSSYTCVTDVGASGTVGSINALTGALNVVTGTAGTNFNINSTGTTITLNLPTASSANRGLLSSADWTLFNAKLSDFSSLTSGDITGKLGYTPLANYGSMTSTDVTTALGYTPVNSATAVISVAGRTGTVTLSSSDISGLGTLAGKSTIVSADLSAGSVTFDKLNQSAATTGQVIKWNGSAWVVSDDSSSAGTVTSVTASGPLSSSGGATPNITITQANGTTSGYLSSADWSLFNAKLSDFSSLTSADITGKLGYTPLANYGSMTSTDVTTALGYTPVNSATAVISVAGRTGTVTLSSSDISGINFGTTSGTFAEGNDSRLTDERTPINNSVTTAKIVDGTITSADISAGAITFDKLNQSSATTGQVIKWDGSAWVVSDDNSSAGTVTSVTASGPLSSSGGATPNITITQANGTTSGYLSSSDWTLFNAKLSDFSTLTSADITGKLGYTPLANFSSMISTDVTNALGYVPANIGSVILASQMPANCGVGQTLTFSSPTGSWICSNIVLANDSVLSAMISSLDWSKVANRPSTLVGYGISIVSSDITTALTYTPVNRAGDTMTGSLNLPSNGLSVGTNQLVFSGGNVGIGTAAPDALLTVSKNTSGLQTANAALHVAGADGASGIVQIDGYGGSSAIRLARYNGTAASPSSIMSGETEGSIQFYGYTGTGLSSGTNIRAVATENWSSGNLGTAITFTTFANSAGGSAERLRIDHNGNVGIGTSSPSYKLDVAGDVNITGNFKVNGVNISTGGGTVTSVTSVGAPIVMGGTSADPTISITQANGTTSGYLSSADWSLFNAKLSDFSSLTSADITGKLGYTPLANYGSMTSTDVTTALGYTPVNSATAVISVAGRTGAVTLSSADISGLGTLAGKSTIVSADLSAGSITFDKLNQSSASTGQVIKWNGSSWIASSDSGIASLTSTDITTALTYTPVNRAGDTMTGALNLPSNGLAVGTNELVVSSGRVGIGTSAPGETLTISKSGSNATMMLEQTDSGAGYSTASLGIANYGGTSGSTGTYHQMTSSRGSKASPTPLQTNDTIAVINARTRPNAGNDLISGAIEFVASENHGALSVPAHMYLRTTPSGSFSPTTRISILSSGQVGIGITNPSYALDVSGDVNVTGVFRVNGSAVGSGTVTAVTASSPLSSSGGTSPNLTIARATASADGYLASTDWTTFNSKLSDFSTLTSADITGKLGYTPLNPANNLSDVSNAATARTNLGLGTGNSPTLTGLTLSGVAGNTLVKTNGSGVLSNANSADVTSLLGYTPANGSSYVAKSGDTMTGALNLPSNGLAVGTNEFVVSGGNVGIGTSSPGSKLTISEGDFRIANETSSGTDVQIDNHFDSSEGPFILLRKTRGTKAAQTYSQMGDSLGSINFQNKDYVEGASITASATSAHNVSTANTSLIFKTTSGTVSQTRMIIDEVGRVSIGIPSPSYSLDVSGDVNVTGNFRVNGSILGSSQWTTSGSHIYYNSGNVGIGTSTPNFKLELAGVSSNDGTIGINGQRAFYLPDQTTFTGSLFLGDGGAHLTNSGGTDGQANTGAGLGALYFNESGHDNAAVGKGALYSNTSGSQNTAVGSGALYSNTSPSDNTAIGYSALYSNISGSDNVAVGSWAMYSTDSGYGNAALGSNVMYNNVDGGANTAVGQEALGSNRSKSDSTAVGYLSMKYADNTSSWVSSYNTAIGAFSLRGSTTPANNTGIQNTALGHSALMGMTSGSGNIGIGYNSGSSITTGSNNIIIGSNTGSTIATSSNNILIADGAGNERIRVNSSGQVGIGTNAPTSVLTVSGDTTLAGTLAVNATTGVTLGGTNLTNQTVRFHNMTGMFYYGGTTFNDPDSGQAYDLKLGGSLKGLAVRGQSTFLNRVGFGVTSPSYSVDVSGDVNVTGNFKVNGVNISTGSGTVSSGTTNKLAYYTGATTVSSNTNMSVSSGALTLGTAGSALGSLAVTGSTSGTVTIQPQATAGTYNFNLPITAGTSGQVLTSGGGAAAPMTWLTLANSASVDTTNASNISSGTLASGRLPAFTGDVTTLAGSSATTIATSAVTSAKILDGTIASADISAAAITFDKLNQSSATTGQVIKWDGSAWIASSDSTGGGGGLPALGGSAAAPGYAFSGDTNTGIFSSIADTLSFSTAGNEIVTIKPTGKIGINNTDPYFDLELNKSDNDVFMSVSHGGYGTGTYYSGFYANHYMGPSNAGTSRVVFNVYRGAGGSPAAVQTGDTLGEFLARGGSDTSWNVQDGASITFKAAGNYTNSSSPGDISLATTSSGSTTPVERMVINSAGNVGIGAAVPGWVDSQGTGTGNLYVNGYSIFNGRIVALDLIAAVDGTAGGAGYDFKDNVNGLGMYRIGADILGFTTASTERMRIDASGNVGIGATTPRATLDVTGAIVSRASQSFAAGTIDFSVSNLRHTTQNCGSFALHNLKDGGTYMFAVQGTTVATCSFTAFSDAGSTALTVHMPPDHGATTSGKHTIYNIAVMGTHAYIAWTPGY